MQLWQKSSLAVFVLAFSLLLARSSPAHEGGEAAAAEPSPGHVLGQISFPTSSRVPEAQEAFIQGMLLLHLFEYPYAREEFLRAQQIDPELAMAYWGEAMTYNHPIWDEQDLAAARDALMKLGPTPEIRVSRTPVAREQGLLASLEQLYGPGTKAQRDQAYMRAMEQLATAFPEDHEVQLFYALSLFGVQAGVRATAPYMLATAIAQGVFSENPQHPGAAHYLIHGVDDPVHAVLGLRAARALALMAPDAGHAQHMTSHIFVAVGMWDDVVAANQAAVKVANAMRAERGGNARSWGHYNYWLLYGYLQQGREDRARELLEAAYAEARAHGKAPEDPMGLDPDRSLVGSVVQMWARYLIETRGWDSDVANWTFMSGDAYDPNLTISYMKAMQAAFGSQVAQAGQFHGQFRSLKSALEAEIDRQDEQAPGDLLYLERLNVLDREVLAAIEWARGDMGKAVQSAREASRLEEAMPFSFGPPFIDLPSAELLGDLLMASRQYSEAAEAYQLQLGRTRLKPRALEGLASALEQLGREAEARYYRSKLGQIRRGAEASRVEAESG
jgi:tetratricopeptide (TPR) repeat protein